MDGKRTANTISSTYVELAESFGAHVAIPLRKGGESENLRTAINQALTELSESGELSQLSMKYFGSDISENPQVD